MKVIEVTSNILRFVSDYDELEARVLAESELEMSDLNREQLWAGIRADGSRITPEYTIFTISKKQEKGQPTDRVTLFDTGSFQEGIFTAQQGEQVIFSSTDSKTDELQEKYGEKIFGLTPDHSMTIKEITTMKLAQLFKQYTGV